MKQRYKTLRPKYHCNGGGVAPYWETDPSAAAPVLLVVRKPRLIGGNNDCIGKYQEYAPHNSSQAAARQERHAVRIALAHVADDLEEDVRSPHYRTAASYRFK